MRHSRQPLPPDLDVLIHCTLEKLRLRAPRTGLRTGFYGTNQCTPSSAVKLVIPESKDAVIATAASTPPVKPTFAIAPRTLPPILTPTTTKRHWKPRPPPL